MASPLMSLTSLGTIKHVVPWKSRQEFISVYEDLYSEDVVKQKQAINRIVTWKSRSWNKLSVAIESSSSLQQVLLDYSSAQCQGCLQEREAQLKANSSLALIRFVNHITEKAQTKQVAQPVHLVAREFGIPEWIVRVRHDATHGAIPCLDVLMTGVRWALNYLREQFWKQQLHTNRDREERHIDKSPPWRQQLNRDKDEEEHTDKSPPGRRKLNTDRDKEEELTDKPPTAVKLKMSAIRETLYDFQKARYKEMNTQKEEDKKDLTDSHTIILQTLQSYFNKNRLQFIRCFLEDGILVATQEQLAVFGVWSEDLLLHSPPTIPVEISEFWRPVLRMVYNSGGLPLLLHCAMFSITAEIGLKNYQLVAWLIYFLAQSTDTGVIIKKKKRKKQENLVKGQLLIPKKTLLAACLQNVNSYTVHLLKFLADKESLGPEVYDKMITLLKIDVQAASGSDGKTSTNKDTLDGGAEITCGDRDPTSEGQDSKDVTPKGQDSPGRDVTSDGTESDSDYKVYTVEDLKKEKERASTTGEDCSTVINVQNSIGEQEIPWVVCTDLVDWSTVPFGTIPTPVTEETDDEEDEDDQGSNKSDNKEDDDEENCKTGGADLGDGDEKDSKIDNTSSDGSNDDSKLVQTSSDEEEEGEGDKKEQSVEREDERLEDEEEVQDDGDGDDDDVSKGSAVKRKRRQSSEEESDDDISHKRPAVISSEEALSI